MGYAKVDICNIALGHLGVSETIAAMDERSKNAVLCNRNYDHVLRTVLEDFWWPFATVWVAGAQLTSDPPPGWQFTYAYPSDCARVRKIVPQGGDPSWYSWRSLCDDPYTLRPRKIPFSIIADPDRAAMAIATNEPEAILCYTKIVDDPTLYTASFADAVALQLAARLCMPLRVDDQRTLRITQMYGAALGKAERIALSEAQAEPDPLPSSIRARL
ncbi:hypothetical protein [Pandoraea sputorum]|uniref:hypothetical protein n=1 Tax=Pandoraea sputorum TaxID=93222 RepID=UPI00124071EB|nr:hypothetical protein [Pandoraea sputorum]VVE77393.1 hypothetical protein PSP31120_01269 [Pandoraea sputorum]